MATFSEDRVKEIIAKELEVETQAAHVGSQVHRGSSARTLWISWNWSWPSKKSSGSTFRTKMPTSSKTVGDAMNYLKSHATAS